MKVDLVAIEKLPGSAAEAFEPLASRARLIIGLRGSNPILPSPRLLAGSGLGFRGALATALDESGAHAAFIGSWSGLLTPGKTWALDGGDPESRPALPSGDRPWRHFELLFHREMPAKPGGGIEVAVAKEDEGSAEAPPESAEESGGMELAAAGPSAALAARPIPVKEIQREVVLLAGVPDKVPAQFSIIIPFRFEGGAGEWVYARITIDEAPPGFKDPFLESSVATANLTYKESNGGGARDGAVAADAADLELKTAVGSLKTAYLRRRALAFLAERTGAGLCQDLALAADDEVLTRLAQKVGEEASAPGAAASPAALGFVLERCGLAVLGGLQNDENLPPELGAALVLHAGEAGRDAAVIEDVLRASTSREDLERRLVEENLICLEDAAPSSRVRALNWLRARNLAPEGFDPMAPLKERRKALDKALAAREEKAMKTEGMSQ